MRLHVFSDVHMDVGTPRRIEPIRDADVVVVAGDVREGAQSGFTWLRNTIPMEIPIVMVLGNHEHYRRCLPEQVEDARSVASAFRIHLLENAETVIGGVRFIGATLWTDYKLFGDYGQAAAMQAAQIALTDHRLITWSLEPERRFQPDDALSLHMQSRHYLMGAMQVPFRGPTVIVTHHAPHRNSVARRFRSHILSAAFASDLTPIIAAGRPAMWIHGHTHDSFDYRVGTTRILCNPNGYGTENKAFDPRLVVEIKG
jgi:Icc-related predicted phosphoesterase